MHADSIGAWRRKKKGNASRRRALEAFFSMPRGRKQHRLGLSLHSLAISASNYGHRPFSMLMCDKSENSAIESNLCRFLLSALEMASDGFRFRLRDAFGEWWDRGVKMRSQRKPTVAGVTQSTTMDTDISTSSVIRYSDYIKITFHQ